MKISDGTFSLCDTYLFYSLHIVNIFIQFICRCAALAVLVISVIN